MTDNNNEMQGSKEGLVAHFNSHNNSIFSYGCLCHKLNLILVNLLKWVSEDSNKQDSLLTEELKGFTNICQFVSSIVGYFNYSYKKYEDYEEFSLKHISITKFQDPNLYSHMKDNSAFSKIPKYCETRWLSLGRSLKSIQEQSLCLLKFFENQLALQKSLKLTSDQVIFLENKVSALNNNEFKYYLTLYE